MDIFSKLTAYDLMGCIPPGFFLLAIFDYLLGTDLVLNGQWDLPKGTLVIFMAYVGGHIVATPSSALLEKVVVQRWFGGPIEHMLWGSDINWWHRAISADFFQPLDTYSQETILSSLPSEIRHPSKSKSIFWHAYTIAKKDEHASIRLSNFLSLYGFCRNISFVSLIGSFALFMNGFIGSGIDGHNRMYSIALLVISYLMFQRYLKFFRAYSVEVITSYRASANLPAP